MRRAWIALGLVTGLAGCAYDPGSFRDPRGPLVGGAGAFVGTRATLECIELSVARRAEPAAEGGVVLSVQFGNRCDTPRTIDLAHLHAVGKTEDGREAKLVAWDPEAELAPLVLDGRAYGSEAIAFRDPAGAALRSACVDLATITNAPTPRWTCFDAPPTEARADAAAEADDAAPTCTPGLPTDYVGHRQCATAFGWWAQPMRLPGMFMDIGVAVRAVQAPTRAPAISSVFRFGLGLPRGVTLGVETEIGGVGAPAAAAVAGPAFFTGGYFLVGKRGAVGRLSLGVELAAGGRIIAGTGSDAAVPALSGVVEARARAEGWIAPRVSGGVTIGAGLLGAGEVMGGAFLSFHSRAFGGDRAP